LSTFTEKVSLFDSKINNDINTKIVEQYSTLMETSDRLELQSVIKSITKLVLNNKSLKSSLADLVSKKILKKSDDLK